MRRLIPLAGLLVALAVPTGAQADSSTTLGLCNEMFVTSTTVPNYENPQRGTPPNQVRWVAAARGLPGSTAIHYGTWSWSSHSVGTGGGYTYCTITGSWRNYYGAGNDSVQISFWVGWSRVGANYHPAAYGTYIRACNYTPDGQQPQPFNVAMPPNGENCNLLSFPPS